MFKKILDNILFLRSLILILICFCGYYAIQLHIPSKLLSFRSFQSNPIIQNFNQLEITNNSNILLLVEGDEEDMKLFSKDIKKKLESFDNWISRVHIDLPIDFYKKNKFKLLDLNQLKDLTSMLKDPNLIEFLKNLNQYIENNFLKKLDINQLEIYETEIFNILDSIEKFINYKKEFLYKSYFDDFGEKSADAFMIGETSLISLNKNMMIVIIEPSSNLINNYIEFEIGIEKINKLILNSKNTYNVKAGLSAPVIINHLEEKEFRKSINTMGLVVLAVLIIVLTFFLKNIISSLVVLISIICSLVCCIVISNYLIESNNIIIVLLNIFSIILLIDFGIRILYKVNKIKIESISTIMATHLIFKEYFYSIFVAGLIIITSSVLILFSDNIIFQNIGLMIIILICSVLFFSIIIIPVLFISFNFLAISNSKTSQITFWLNIFFQNIIFFINRYRKIIIFCFTMVIIFMLGHALLAFKNYNYFSLIDYNSKKNLVEEKIENAFNFSSNYVSFISPDLKTAKDLASKAKAYETFGRVESIIDFIPESDILDIQFRFLKQKNREMINTKIKKYILDNDLKIYNIQMKRLEANIIELQDIDTLKGIVYKKATRLVGELNDNLKRGNLTQYVSKLDSNITKRSLTYLHQDFAQSLKNNFLSLTNSDILEVENLPLEIKNSFIDSQTNSFITRVYSKKNIYQDESIFKAFNSEINNLNNSINKNYSQSFELAKILKLEKEILIYFLISFIISTSILFKSIKYVFLNILLNMIIFILILGTLSLFSIDFNFIYVLIMPIISLLSSSYFIQFKLDQNNQNIDSSYHKKILEPMLVTLFVNILCFSPLYFSGYKLFVLVGQALFISLGTLYFIIYLFLLCFFHEQNLNKKIM